MSRLKGSDDLRRRLKAIGQSFKPIGRAWADTTAVLAKDRVPVKTGRLRKSIRRKNASAKRATVAAHYTAPMVDGGTKAHDIVAKTGGTLAFSAGGRTVFAKKVHHRGAKAQPFSKRAAEESLRRHPMAQTLIDEWNRAA